MIISDNLRPLIGELRHDTLLISTKNQNDSDNANDYQLCIIYKFFPLSMVIEIKLQIVKQFVSVYLCFRSSGVMFLTMSG
ncbi:hypothetical protein PCIT_a3682 [Pseudoalteromonas citrea]|uniref:Uncharacterized protein n=1 Tax=Pseudoalteromonas citrea TaxID=43655 RepID=A0AAD4FQS2_9GAMM|nr:hypothetical protein PCIT_a3682 [Pseudoalteromonas citrea]